LNTRHNVDIRTAPHFPPGTSLEQKAGAVQTAQLEYFEDFTKLINGEWAGVSTETQKAVSEKLNAQEWKKLAGGELKGEMREL
jgi:hypothetical protein